MRTWSDLSIQNCGEQLAINRIAAHSEVVRIAGGGTTSLHKEFSIQPEESHVVFHRMTGKNGWDLRWNQDPVDPFRWWIETPPVLAEGEVRSLPAFSIAVGDPQAAREELDNHEVWWLLDLTIHSARGDIELTIRKRVMSQRDARKDD